MQNINKKKDHNNYFRAETSNKEENYLHLKKNSRFTFQGKLIFFLKSNFYKSKFDNIYMCYEKLTTIFDINTLKLF